MTLILLLVALASPGLGAVVNFTSTESPGNDDIEGKIVSGQPAGYGQFPWQVSLWFDDGVLCGGTLIEPEFVLTAAHCIYGRAAGRVILGAIVWDQSDATSIRISYTVSHPEYKPPSLENDIGIVKMQNAARQGTTIKTIPVAPSYSNLNGGEYVYVSGFGADRDKGSTNNKLNFVLMRIITNEQCQQRNGGGKLHPGSVCAEAEGKKGICAGDSGSSMIQNINNVWTVVGVASFGVGGCESENPNGFARVSYYVPFLRQQTGKNYP